MGVGITCRRVRGGKKRTLPGELQFPTSLTARADGKNARRTHPVDLVAWIFRRTETAPSNLLAEARGVAVRQMEK